MSDPIKDTVEMEFDRADFNGFAFVPTTGKSKVQGIELVAWDSETNAYVPISLPVFDRETLTKLSAHTPLGEEEDVRYVKVSIKLEFYARDDERVVNCSCPTECDCQNPEPKEGVALVSNSCPIHTENPMPAPDCPVHG